MSLQFDSGSISFGFISDKLFETITLDIALKSVLGAEGGGVTSSMGRISFRLYDLLTTMQMAVIKIMILGVNELSIIWKYVNTF